MRVWRISKRQYAKQALSGEGAKLLGGRWNFPGVAVIYTSSSLALAALETFVHLPSPLILPKNLVAIEIEIPDELSRENINRKKLPKDWQNASAPESLKLFGAAWLKKNISAVLETPSAVIPGEVNYLLNPSHPEFQLVKIISREPFEYDPRLKK
jgi:RES domain-containing protein